jgi:hypothetical protein
LNNFVSLFGHWAVHSKNNSSSSSSYLVVLGADEFVVFGGIEGTRDGVAAHAALFAVLLKDGNGKPLLNLLSQIMLSVDTGEVILRDNTK